MLMLSNNTSRINLSTINEKRFKTSFGDYAENTESKSMNGMRGIELWNPFGVQKELAFPTQRALRDAGLWDSTPSAYCSQSKREIRRCLAHFNNRLSKWRKPVIQPSQTHERTMRTNHELRL